MRRGSAIGGGEARNPPLPVADTGGCSANEATSFASVSVAKRLCRIVRAVGHAMAVIIAKKITPLRWLHLIRFTAFSTFSSRRRLPFDIPLIYRYPPCLLPPPNHAPVAR